MQKKDLLSYAKLILGTEDCVIFEDAGYSGKNTDRPKFQEMMSQMRAGVFIPIVSRERKERIISILDANNRLRKNRSRAGKHTHVFGGLIFCGNCDQSMTSSPSNLKASGWRYSNYLCPTKRKSVTLCTGKSTSDAVLGEFIFNYILNMLNAQQDFDNINSPDELQMALLRGNAFSFKLSASGYDGGQRGPEGFCLQHPGQHNCQRRQG